MFSKITDQVLFCRKCNGKHHVSFCSRNQNDTQQDETVTAHAGGFNGSLLQTVLTTRFDDTFVDSGSQQTYITDNLRELLHPQTTRTGNIILNTFCKTNDSHT